MGLLGILLALALLIGMAYRGWSVLLLAPAAALVAAGVAGEPVLAHWTQTFMPAAAGFWPSFSRSSAGCAVWQADGRQWFGVGPSRPSWPKNGATPCHSGRGAGSRFVTYGGVSLFVAFCAGSPGASPSFKAANIPNHLMPAAIVLGTSTFTNCRHCRHASIQNAIPMHRFWYHTLCCTGFGRCASATIMMGIGMVAGRPEANARRAGVVMKRSRGDASGKCRRCTG